MSLLGTFVLLLSLALALLLPKALPAPLRTLGVAVIAVVALSPLLAAAFDLTVRISTHREVTVTRFYEATRQFAGVAIRLGLIHLLVGAVTALNISFYLQLHGIGGRAAVILCVYLLLFWSTMALYQGPLLVLQETGAFDEPERKAKRGAPAVIRRSFYLVISEPLFSIGLWLALVVWTVTVMLTAVGAAMLWLGGSCLLTAAPTLALLAKYGVVDAAESDHLTSTEEA